MDQPNRFRGRITSFFRMTPGGTMVLFFNFFHNEGLIEWFQTASSSSSTGQINIQTSWWCKYGTIIFLSFIHPHMLSNYCLPQRDWTSSLKFSPMCINCTAPKISVVSVYFWECYDELPSLTSFSSTFLFSKKLNIFPPSQLFSQVCTRSKSKFLFFVTVNRREEVTFICFERGYLLFGVWCFEISKMRLKLVPSFFEFRCHVKARCSLFIWNVKKVVLVEIHVTSKTKIKSRT